ncbi:transcription factor MYB1R1-like [Quercus lobata]|uniref:transcription factor MYB1R1-like n=1 Tax=Quercus lobata TaxID=97700 RepID=UPI00124869D2|nr:transcription factor MYB1R1-like [Quercus lobata]
MSIYNKKNNNNTTTTVVSGNYNSNNTSSSIGNYNNNNVSVATGNTDNAGRIKIFGKRWTEQEQRLFLTGLKELRKGNWRGISRRFVKTRSTSQVASHAQKYYLRQTAIDKKKTSVFDLSLNEANNVDNHNPMKKSVSMGNPSSEKVENNDSEDDAEDLADGVSQRKRWTEEEHKIFLIGLKKLGRGDWKGISQKFVTTRSPSQVASHAQKYFLRKAAIDKKKPRSSVFDVSLNETELAPKDFSVSHMEKSDTETSSLGASSSQALALVNRYPHVSMHIPSPAQMRPPVFGAPNYHSIPSIHSRASMSARMSLNLKLDILIPTPEQRYPLRRQEP